MKWKKKDELSWCCSSTRHRRDSDDDNCQNDNKQISTAVLVRRSSETAQSSSSVEKPKIPSTIAEFFHRHEPMDNNPNGNRSQSASQDPNGTSLIKRSNPPSTSNNYKDIRSEDEPGNEMNNINRSNTATSLNEQAKPDELASGFATMGLLNDEDMNKLNTTFDSMGSSNESVERTNSKHGSYKMQKQSYQTEKKRITSELATVLKDPSVVIVSDWLKVRGTLRDWTKYWVILKPGLMLLYRSPQNGVWVGTVVLSSCEVIQRPSKKLGFCFKIWHPLEKSIWAQKGPNNEQFGALTFPLPMNYLIFRASDETTGRCWMDALELTMKCSKLLKRPYSSSNPADDPSTAINSLHIHPPSNSLTTSGHMSYLSTSFSDNDLEFNRLSAKEDDDRMSEVSGDNSKASRSNSSHSETSRDGIVNEEDNETPYIAASPEEMGELGNAAQTEEVAEENKSLIFHLLKQVRPGMDLSKVVLPTFILEPRSFLEKLSDYYHHCDILEEAVNSPDPLVRMKTIVKFYLSGFYKKPKGLKKPYNPVIGEVYRCFFHHTKTDSKTFYLAEQISHHPPVTNFYVSNRKEGFCVQGSILARSKFYGNSLSAILDGAARLTLLNRGEDYVITMPYANCKGILIGKLTMELGGKVTIVCEKTRYSAEIEFKLKPFIGGQELTNHIEGKIKLEKDVLYTFSGHWDDEIIIVDKATDSKSVFWKVTQNIVNARLKRYVVPIEQQQENESERLWQRVTAAIRQNDQIMATEEKTLVEDEQRKQIKERKATGVEWHPRLFNVDPSTKEWVYAHGDVRAWDPYNDISTYESNFVICTRTRHPACNVGNNSRPSISRSRSATNTGSGLTSALVRGPSPALNNLPDERSPVITAKILTKNPNQPTLCLTANDDSSSSILNRIETILIRTNERLDAHERAIYTLQGSTTIALRDKTTERSSSSSFVPLLTQFLFIVIVAFILKLIFR